MLPKGEIVRAIEEQRQNFALPLWGIAGWGLLEGCQGISYGWIVAVASTVGAFSIQKWGWQMQAKRLLMKTFEDIDNRLADLK